MHNISSIKKVSVEKNTEAWKKQLAEAVTEANTLYKFLDLDPDQFQSLDAMESFALRVPYSYLNRIKKGEPNDPLLLQILPQSKELNIVEGYTNDPLFEQQANKIPGLLHKYHGRVLLTLTSVCSVNCRYCFRRHFPYTENKLSKLNLARVIEYISSDSSINEIILSGGDPLVATDNYLAKIVEEISTISHVDSLRIHTRLPITIPDRVTEKLTSILSKMKHNVVVLHCNHPNELDENVCMAVQKLKAAGITVLNQTVLLKNINDNAYTLEKT